ncbi:ABC transporter ATP-binding protein [Membranihabitans marinus]|uniref:ABC transporter ATP-binding protein n=1 Tax=Membranihabitans marinus TaxID=1227546 RepID=UPI001F01295F|nr:ATP-binding cassette domain-containing protein [Membranihabitans marinus]
MTVLQTKDLSKNYGQVTALSGLNLSVQQGDVLGILGPNGSGKTTTLSIVLNAIWASSGSYQWFGNQPSSQSLKRVGALLESPIFFPNLTAIQNLDIIGHIRGVKDRNYDDILYMVDLYDRRNHKFSSYSLGMKQRLAIASVMLGSPEVMIFDEPTNGLDPKGIVDIRNILVGLAQSGKTIILASHILDEVEKICTQLAILNQGKLLAHGHISDILVAKPILELSAANNDLLLDWIQRLPGYRRHLRIGERFQVFFDKVDQGLDINEHAHRAGHSLTHFQWIQPKLEDAYLKIIENGRV